VAQQYGQDARAMPNGIAQLEQLIGPVGRGFCPALSRNREGWGCDFRPETGLILGMANFCSLWQKLFL
jgi:hypothetical protein